MELLNFDQTWDTNSLIDKSSKREIICSEKNIVEQIKQTIFLEISCPNSVDYEMKAVATEHAVILTYFHQ